MNQNIISLILFLLISAVPVYAQQDNGSNTTSSRILLKIPYKDREGLMKVMRNNLQSLNKMISAMAENDFKSVQSIAKNMSFNKKKGKGLSRRGNAAFMAMGIRFHTEDTAAIMKAAEKRDRKATLHAMANMVSTCVACHSTFRVMEWPNNKSYKRPNPMKLVLPKEFNATK